jgi:trans-aconitate 2-methyltransferase
MSHDNHYTFGDNDLAAQRLRLLAEAFEPSTRALLARASARCGGRAIDLGCGPGYTTDLVREMVLPSETVGIDKSARLVAMARARSREGVRFVEHDVTALPFPVPPADLIYARFLVTHLSAPEGAIAAWANVLCSGGHLVLEETAYMRSPHSVFQRYYAIVEAMQAHYGQVMYIGNALDELCTSARAGLAIALATTAALSLPAERMARIHAMNIGTWKSDPFIRATYDAREIDAIERGLDRVARGEESAPPVACGMRQIVLRRL